MPNFVDMQSFMVIRTYLFVSIYIYVKENNKYMEEGGLFYVFYVYLAWTSTLNKFLVLLQ